jgi:membrane associated rhomboid family serine protease
MFFPIGTDHRPPRRPYVNIGLIVVNVVIFIAIWMLRSDAPRAVDARVGQFMLSPWQPNLLQFFTYQFLHANIEHLLFNMLFLYVFGNAVEGRLGHIGYLGFYLAGGVAAGVGYAVTGDVRMLGASGSIAAVSGAFLALFPLTRVIVVVWFFIITAFRVPAIWVIAFYFGRDLISHLVGVVHVGNVAYVAHLCGNAFGFAVGMALLWTRVLPREPYDFVGLVDRWRRRRQMRRVTRRDGSPWMGAPGRSVQAGPVSSGDQRLMQMRQAIREALQAGEIDRALDTYERILADHPEQVMSRDVQLELANHAMRTARHGTAQQAYELFLKSYPNDAQQAQVQLLLGLICARYLDRHVRARQLLTAARDRLGDEERTLAEQLLTEIGAPSHHG